MCGQQPVNAVQSDINSKPLASKFVASYFRMRLEFRSMTSLRIEKLLIEIIFSSNFKEKKCCFTKTMHRLTGVKSVHYLLTGSHKTIPMH